MAKGAKVTQTAKEKMWKLYQEVGGFKKVAEKMNQSHDTVSRYVHEYEAAICATGYVLNSK